MTQVGHCLTGAAFGVLATPAGAAPPGWVTRLGAFMLLANVPDLPFPGWSHQRYDLSHSLLVNLALVGAAAAWLAAAPRARARLGGWPVVALGAAAWLSHLVLDTLYVDSAGLAMFWPLSDSRVRMPVPWFHIVRVDLPVLAPANLRVFVVELAAYAPLVALAAAYRGAGLARARATQGGLKDDAR